MLFADGFGTFGALNGNIFADEVDFDRDWLDDARRYYTNIVGKYGASVQASGCVRQQRLDVHVRRGQHRFHVLAQCVDALC